MTYALRVFVFLAPCVVLTSPALAQRPASDAKRTATTIADADADYALQGEYISGIDSPCGGPRLGLQVVALGDGKFDAVAYQGGLPGAGWDRRRKSNLAGQREGAAALVRGRQYGASITPGWALLRDAAGNYAWLRKIHRTSPTMGAAPPPGATVLFRGPVAAASQSSASQVSRVASAAPLLEQAELTEDGWLKPGFLTTWPVQDFRLHVEFRTPYMPQARGQGRGNSGVYIQRRYEVQILDSFGLAGVENEGGALYKRRRPDVNMSLPPLVWQTYDIYFTAARWNAQGEKNANARLTVLHNGLAIHDDVEIPDKTGAGRPESPEPLPIQFQHHKDPVAFRNLWIVAGTAAARPRLY